jgi:hypothetical protein
MLMAMPIGIKWYCEDLVFGVDCRNGVIYTAFLWQIAFEIEGAIS